MYLTIAIRGKVFDKCYTAGVFDKCYAAGVIRQVLYKGKVYDKCHTGEAI
jgi:hypothetical protein